MKNPERLMGAFIHRHFTAYEIRPDGRQANAEQALDSGPGKLVKGMQVAGNLADVFIQ